MNKLVIIFSYLVFYILTILPVSVFSSETNNVSTPDPNFHVYICFGQSNMEGASPITDADRIGVNQRFKVMTVSADDYNRLGRKVGEWYTATPPLCRWDNGLTPADYFGRTLTDNLPDSIKVGVIVVAMGGSGIDAFDKENYKQYYQNADAWQKSLMNIYGGNPYSKIIEMAKKAQQSGVIKGILLHQGESNNGQTDWPLKVKKIYNDMLNDLNIKPNTIPLLSGEMLYKNQGGICWGMNSVIANLPIHIPNSHIISSDGCTGIDDFHFSNAGQRELGKRFGSKMLSLVKTYNTIEGQTVDKLIVDNNNFTMLTGTLIKLPLTAQYLDGHTQDVSYLADYTIENPKVVEMVNGFISTIGDGESKVTAMFKGNLGQTKEVVFNVKASTFPLTNNLFDPKVFGEGTFDEKTKTLKTGQWGFGGWQYQGINLSDYKYIVVRLGSDNNADVTFNIYDGASYWGSPASFKFGSKREVVVPLKYSKKNDGSNLNPEHIYIAGFWSNGNNPFVIDTVFLSNSNEYDSPLVFAKNINGADLSKIDGFNYRENSGPSDIKSFIVSGDMIKGEIKVEATTDFEISLSETEDFKPTVVLASDDGIVDNVKIFVRLKQGLLRKTYSGSIVISANGATSKKIVLSGKVEIPVGSVLVSNSDIKILVTEYYTISGKKVNKVHRYKGFVIEKNILSDGSVITFKKILF